MSKVLIIDDDPAIREVIAGGLSEQGWQVFLASEGQQGLALVPVKHPDVIVVDAMMPGMDGFAICRKIKSSTETAHIPIVFLTARSSSADVEHGLLTGADDYITKPFDIYQLADRLENLVKLSRPPERKKAKTTTLRKKTLTAKPKRKASSPRQSKRSTSTRFTDFF